MPWNLVTIESIKAPGRYTLVGGPFGSELTTRDYSDEGVPVIRGSNLPMDREFVDDGFVFVREEKADALNGNTAYPGDLVFTQRGTLGQVGLIPDNAIYKRYVISQSQMKLTVDADKVDPRFVYYFFRHPDTIQRIKNNSLTSGVPHINLGVLRTFKIPLPPLAVQKSITAILSGYDSFIENNRRRMALLEESARLLYREWFVRLRYPGHERIRISDGLPNGWRRCSIGEIADCVGGGTPSTAVPSYWDEGDVTWVTPTDVTRNKHIVLLDSEKKITEAGLKASSAKLVPPHAVLMTSRASVGYFAIVGREVCTNQGFISIVAQDPLLAPYLLFHLSERAAEIRAMGSGSTFPEVSRTKFREFEILLPSHALTSVFSELAAQLLMQIRVLKRQSERLQTARDLLLPRLMDGYIIV